MGHSQEILAGCLVPFALVTPVLHIGSFAYKLRPSSAGVKSAAKDQLGPTFDILECNGIKWAFWNNWHQRENNCYFHRQGSFWRKIFQVLCLFNSSLLKAVSNVCSMRGLPQAHLQPPFISIYLNSDQHGSCQSHMHQVLLWYIRVCLHLLIYSAASLQRLRKSHWQQEREKKIAYVK